MIMNIESSCSVFHFIMRFARGYLSTKLVLISSEIVIHHHHVKRFSMIKKDYKLFSFDSVWGRYSLFSARCSTYDNKPVYEVRLLFAASSSDVAFADLKTLLNIRTCCSLVTAFGLSENPNTLFGISSKLPTIN